MSSVGTLTVDIIRGVALTARQTVETWEVSGVDGWGAILNASRAPEFRILTIFYAVSSSDADAHGLAANALQGTTVTLTDDWGDPQDNVVVLEADCTDFKMPVNYNGNPDAVRCSVKWRMRVAGS